MRDILKVLFLWIFSSPLYAQTYSVGVSYFSEEDHVEYIHGNLPIILSAPHGGEKRPNDIPDRNCSGCVTINDTNTQELTREITAALVELTGCHPHVIINRLHRSKLDANREIVEAADGNQKSEIAWSYYHAHVDSSRQFVTQDFGKGIFLDIHGHGHEIQRLELGYLLSKSDLQESDSHLDGDDQISKSSIRHLVSHNLRGHTHAELIRGNISFGSFLTDKMVDAVPSPDDPFPFDDDAYFTGGYNTREYGSRNSGSIDAIQLECHQDVRFDDGERKRFADSLALVILDYVKTHYFDMELSLLCSPSQVDNSSTHNINVFPNPVNDQLYISTDLKDYRITVLNILGQTIYTSDRKVNEIDVSQFKSGIYTLILYKENAPIHQTPYIKN